MRVGHVNIVVADMERSLAFSVGLLGMRGTFEAHLTAVASAMPGMLTSRSR
jgi:catechol 2,3-dioxygenase-like lactoylglutathione lyase family enzyme